MNDKIDFDFKPKTYFETPAPSVVLVRLHYPESQWGDDLTIFAEKLDGEIYYEVVDFYGNTFHTDPVKSKSTLKLSEIIYLIETIEITNKEILGSMDITLMGTPEVESEVYPQLKKYFDEKRRSGF
ncbi:UDP-glucuronosyltransferase [Penaeicola halotolerans]|uniref:UDP-glucuronosyltransferase n=1 Tax=Penaeicola halotolerans TaxID=2793196 RepID=UPI001CF917E6|nr:UDP-glucuronosyltransferase [Penaeicola halotolerans]